MDTPPLSTMLEAATAAVVDACTVCRSVAADKRGISTMTKDDRSPVTVADFASQAIINHRLHQRFGAYAMVAEETAKVLREAGQSAILARVLEAVRTVWRDADEQSVLDAIDLGEGTPVAAGQWTLDPIDGTKGFLRGGQYAVSLAFLHGGQPVLGVLGCPNLPLDLDSPLDVPDSAGAMYWALRGKGCFAASLDAPGEVQPLVDQSQSGGTITLVGSVESGHSNQDDAKRILDGLDRPWQTVRIDSQAKYAVVARRQADVYLRMPTRADYREAIWDHAAGYVVAREAGCEVTDIRGRALDFSRGPRLSDNLGVVCARRDLHPALIRRIQAEGLDASLGDA